MPSEGESELRRFAALDPGLFSGQIVSAGRGRADTIFASGRKIERRKVRKGDLNPIGNLVSRIGNPLRKSASYRRRWQGATTSNSSAIARRSNAASGGESRGIRQRISGSGH